LAGGECGGIANTPRDETRKLPEKPIQIKFDPKKGR